MGSRKPNGLQLALREGNAPLKVILAVGVLASVGGVGLRGDIRVHSISRVNTSLRAQRGNDPESPGGTRTAYSLVIHTLCLSFSTTYYLFQLNNALRFILLPKLLSILTVGESPVVKQPQE